MPINFLELMDDAIFPMTKAELIAWAEDQDASEEALDILQALPHEEYESFAMFNREVGMIEQLPGSRANLFSSSQSQ